MFHNAACPGSRHSKEAIRKSWSPPVALERILSTAFKNTTGTVRECIENSPVDPRLAPHFRQAQTTFPVPDDFVFYSIAGETMFIDPSVHKAVFLIAVVLFTAVTAWTDTRWRRIPNNITLPMWIGGWIYQGVFFQWSGLLDGMYGFGIGFGLFFVLWMVGSAGGGDVKLMGALSVWLGPGLTLKVLLCSLIFVVLGTFVVVIGSVLTNGWNKTRRQFTRDDAEAKRGRKQPETMTQRQKRRVMAFAMPVALATWSVLLLFQHEWLQRGVLNL